jgi:hypothetical protein
LICSQSKLASRGVDAWRGFDRLSGRGGKAEFVNVIAGDPFPDDVAFRRNFDQAIVFERGVGDKRPAVVDVRQD